MMVSRETEEIQRRKWKISSVVRGRRSINLKD